MTKIINDLNIGQILKHYRTVKKYTQMDVVREANLLGSKLSESTYSKIEQGTRNIFASDLVILKLVLDISYDDFFKDYEKSLLNNNK